MPPLAFIFESPKHEWGMWDIRLAKAVEIYDNIMTGGVPIYWDRSDRVTFTTGSFISKSKAALDRAEEKAREGKAKNYGKVFYPIAKSNDDNPILPTMEEWMEEQAKKKNMSAGNFTVTDSEFDNGHLQSP